MKKRALVFVGHGSRREASNLYLKDFSERLGQRLSAAYTMTELAFLEICQPDIKTSVQTCVEAGATEVHLYPYFLAPGNHVQQDIPEEVAALATRFVDIKIQVLPYLGDTPHWDAVVADAIQTVAASLD